MRIHQVLQQQGFRNKGRGKLGLRRRCEGSLIRGYTLSWKIHKGGEQGEPVFSTAFHVNIAQVVFHGLLRYLQAFRDFRIFASVQDTSQHIRFPSREPVLRPDCVQVQLIGEGVFGDKYADKGSYSLIEMEFEGPVAWRIVKFFVYVNFAGKEFFHPFGPERFKDPLAYG